MKKIIFPVLCLLVLLNIGCVKDKTIDPSTLDSTTTSTYIPSLKDTTSIATLKDLDSGRVIYMNKCIACHSLYKLEVFTPDQWIKYGNTMGSRSKLTYAQDTLLIKYLTKGKGPLLDPATLGLYVPSNKDTTVNASLQNLMDGRSLYLVNCKSCHNYYTAENVLRSMNTKNSWYPTLQDSVHKSIVSPADYPYVINYLTKGALPIKPTFVSFKGIIIPMINENCISCHNASGQKPDLTRFSTIYTTMTSTTIEGCGVDTVNVSNSGLVKTLTGKMAGKLSDSEMQLLLKWISEGAKNN